jgi:hypothetical protein
MKLTRENRSTRRKACPSATLSTTNPILPESSQYSYQATGWTIRVSNPRGTGILLSSKTSRPALGPTQPPVGWVLGAVFTGVKWPGSETDHSPPSSAEVTNVWSYNSILLICLQGMYRDSFTLPLRKKLKSVAFKMAHVLQCFLDSL